MAIGYDAQMRPRIYEWFNGQWRIFPRLGAPLTAWPKWLSIAPQGQFMQLSNGVKAYDWITDNGAYNLLHWTHDAALATGISEERRVGKECGRTGRHRLSP